MSSTRDSPSSPRRKRQQIEQQWDGWDESSVKLLGNVPQHTGMGTTKVKTPNRTSPAPLPYKCPLSPRSFHPSTSSPYEQQPSSASPSGRSSGYNAYVGPNNGRCEQPPRSPKITTTFATDSIDDVASTPSYYQTPTSGSYSPKAFSSHENSVDSPFYSSGLPSASPRRSPKSPRKFVFDAISPLKELRSQQSQYYEPVPPDTDPLARGNKDSGDDEKYGYFETPHSPKVYAATPNTLRKNSQKFGRFSGVADRQISTYAFDEKSSYSGSYKDQQAIDWDSPAAGNALEEFRLCSPAYLLKRDSCVTESTQLSAESNHTNTTAITTTSFTHSERSQVDLLQRRSKSGTSSPVDSTASSEYKHNARSRRRDAINITSNPAYHVLHSSHSTLGHTCSDSVVSLRYRKSTSDLTKDTHSDFVKAKPSVATTSTELTNASIITHGTSRSRRRGSSKGGLAYLASRRGSRESMKSACSNASIFSNDDDIGPLAFQASNRSHQRRTSNFLELPVPDHIRPRVCSLPDRPYNPRASDDLYRLRHFSISKGNVVNCGDSIISRRSRSNTSVNSTNSRASERSPFDGSCCGGGYANVDSVPASPEDSENSDPPPPPRYRVVMLGEAGVGKTALVSQFMTSEYMHTYDASLDDEFGEKTVSVLLDNEESELVFIDHPSIEMSVENSLSTYEPHGCVVTFSVVDRSSFRVAEEIVNYLWQENYTKDKAVILVGNKADLARSRVISTQEGKSLAASRGAKFIETSSGIQHNVDELLVGILKQMRLKETRVKKATSSKMKTSRTHISLHLAKEILQKICLSDISKSKSCENLHVL